MKKAILFFLCISFIISCKKTGTDNNTNVDNTTSADYLSDEQLQIIENAGIDTTTTFQDLLLPDGTNISEWGSVNDSGYQDVFNLRVNPASDKKTLFIKSMEEAGFRLVDMPIGSQKKLAYVYGSLHINEPSVSKPQKGGQPAVCQTPFYGLECAGMIYQMANASDVSLKEGHTWDYVKTKTWNDAFKNSPDFSGLQMTDLPGLDSNLIEPGDIIVASTKDYNHIGMAYDNGKFIGILHSIGSPSYSCEKNSNNGHGPVRTKNLKGWIKNTFGLNYHILRVMQNGLAGLSTTKPNSITETSAVSGGNITNDGGSSITARGVCWSTSHNPTITDDTTLSGFGTGNFTSNITGLTANVTYYVRAYATNSSGTAYGKEISFVTDTTQWCTFEVLYKQPSTGWVTWTTDAAPGIAHFTDPIIGTHTYCDGSTMSGVEIGRILLVKKGYSVTVYQTEPDGGCGNATLGPFECK